jgi:hypothetical protein
MDAPTWVEVARAAAERLLASTAGITRTVLDAAPAFEADGWHTEVLAREHWHDVPVNGYCAGRTFRVIQTYRASDAAGSNTILVRTEHEVWPRDETGQLTPVDTPSANG